MYALGAKRVDLKDLLPIQPSEREQTLDEVYSGLLAFSERHNAKFNGHHDQHASGKAGP